MSNNKKNQSKMVEIINQVNHDMQKLVSEFQEDLARAKAIQKQLIPQKFKSIPGLKVKHKYLSGMKSGGDYLDFFEFDDGTHVGILMTDSTGYGLSSTFMSIMLKMAMKFSKSSHDGPSYIVEKLFEELKLTMKDTENFSIFFGILNRKTFDLHYTGAGNIRFLVQSAVSGKNKTQEYGFDVKALTRDVDATFKEYVLHLMPADRLILLSDGFYQAYENENDFLKTIHSFYNHEALEFINDCTFHVKKKFNEEDDMPDEDCSVMVIDIEKNAMRVAK